MTAYPAGPEPAESSAAEFLLTFTQHAHEAGYPTADLEERFLSLAAHFDLPGAQISATPTLVEVSFGSLAEQRSFSLRVSPRAVDLDAIARLDDLVRDILDGKTDIGAAHSRLSEIEAHPLARPWFVRIAAYAVAGAAVTRSWAGAGVSSLQAQSSASSSAASRCPRAGARARSRWSRPWPGSPPASRPPASCSSA